MLRTKTVRNISYACTSNCRSTCALKWKVFSDMFHTHTYTHAHTHTHTQYTHTRTHTQTVHTHSAYSAHTQHKNHICKAHPSDLLQVTTATSWTTWCRMPLPLLSPPTRCMMATTTTTCRGLTASPACRWRATGRTTPIALGPSTSCVPSANSWRQDSASVGLSWLARRMIWRN